MPQLHYTTRLSSKGQLVIPKQIREKCQWENGTVFDVVEADGGLLIKPKQVVPTTCVEDTFGMVTVGKSLTVEDMNEVLASIKG